MEIRRIGAAETYPLRDLVLRNGQGNQKIPFEGDDAPGSFHLGIFDEHEMLLGVVSALLRPHQCFESQSKIPAPNNIYQIRGMAILPELQKAGVGTELFNECLRQLQGKSIWMNARTNAVVFYEKFGFEKWGAVFEIKNIGPHQVLFKP